MDPLNHSSKETFNIKAIAVEAAKMGPVLVVVGGGKIHCLIDL